MESSSAQTHDIVTADGRPLDVATRDARVPAAVSDIILRWCEVHVRDAHVGTVAHLRDAAGEQAGSEGWVFIPLGASEPLEAVVPCLSAAVLLALVHARRAGLAVASAPTVH